MKSPTNQILINMSATKTKIDAILDAISQDIAERERVANDAMHTLEMFKTTTEDYKEANLQFGANWFVAVYLKRIKEGVMKRELKTAENLIRFHAYQQYAKGNLDDGRDISLGQSTVAVILDGYVQKFFEA